jgi:hypothetical protein
MNEGLATFAAWMIVGFIVSVGSLYAFTPLGPAIIVVIALAAWWIPGPSQGLALEILGVPAGIGVGLLFLGSAADDDLRPILFFVGAIAVAGSVGTYLLLGRRRCRRDSVASRA